MEEDGRNDAYSWETAYSDVLKIREILQEDEYGSVARSVAKLKFEQKREKYPQVKPSNVRMGLIRYVYIMIDCAECMSPKGIYPSRLNALNKTIFKFLDRFANQNPLSQMGIIVCKDKRAEKLVALTGNIRLVKEGLATLSKSVCSGEFSLHNGLILALQNLRDYPGHASREVLLITSSISTCDSCNIFGTIELLKRYNVRCSIISLTAEVFVFKKLCSETLGTHNVVLEPGCFEGMLCNHIIPPIAQRNAECTVLRVGFPSHEVVTTPSFCLCHQSEPPKPYGRAFFCPQCGARYCSLPIECRVCKLLLVSALQLARSSIHITPLPPFQEAEITETETLCFGCVMAIELKGYRCTKCDAMFCVDCDILLHDSLQSCPSCR